MQGSLPDALHLITNNVLNGFFGKFKNDLILLGIICVCAGLITGGVYLLRKPGAYVRIEADGETVKILPLDTEWTEFFDNGSGGINAVRIDHGKVSCIQASCPDKLCIHMGEISHIGESVVCLPNRFVITVISEEEAGR